MRQIKIIGLIYLLFVGFFPFREYPSVSGAVILQPTHHNTPYPLSRKSCDKNVAHGERPISGNNTQSMTPAVVASGIPDQIQFIKRSALKKVSVVMPFCRKLNQQLQNLLKRNPINRHSVSSITGFSKILTGTLALLLILLIVFRRSRSFPFLSGLPLFLLLLIVPGANVQARNIQTTRFSVLALPAPVNPGTISSDQTICEGDDVIPFTSTAATGETIPTYQWQISTTGAGSGFVNIAGATSQNYDHATLTADAWFKRLATSTESGLPSTQESNVIHITVNNISAGTIGSGQVLCAGESAAAISSLTFCAGDGVLTYQWQSSTTSAAAGFADIAGATAPDYSPTTPAVTTWYKRVAASTLGTSICTKATTVVEITVGNIDAGTISAAGNDLIFCEGENPGMITGTAVAFVAPVQFQGYQWQVSTDGITYSNIAGANQVNYDPPLLSVPTWFRRVVLVKVNGKDCSAAGNELAFAVYPVPTLAPIAPISTCEGSSYTITAVGGNFGSGTPTYTISSSNASSPMPVVVSNSTGVFYIDPQLPPNTPEVGVHNYTITLTNGDPGACTVSQNVTVTIYSLPYITLTASCSSNNDGTIFMTGQLAYPSNGTIEYMLYKNSVAVTGWVENPLFTNLAIASYKVYARNKAYPDCTTFLSDTIKARTVDITAYHVCQNGVISPGEGMQATSQCFTWAGASHTFPEVCSNPAQTYRVSNNQMSYSAGALVQYSILATFKADEGTSEITIKDCKTKPLNSTYSVYRYPFNPGLPGNNFVQWIPSICPTGGKVKNLVPGTLYVLVLNAPDATTKVCSDPWFTKSDKVQMTQTIGEVYWYLNDSITTSIFTGPVFDPTLVEGSGITDTSTPGKWTFWTGCFSGPCRQPVEFIIDPKPIVVAENQTLCSGKTLNIQLSSKDNLNRVIDPATVTYEWYGTNLSGTSTGFESCSLASPCTGNVINHTLTSISSCPVVRYMVRAFVNGCPGDWYPVDVSILDNPPGAHTAPVIPADITYTCLSEVPAPPTITLQHSCLPLMSATGVDTDLGGTGCLNDPHTIRRTWTFVDACETTVGTQIITIVDNVLPTFTRPADLAIYTDAFCSYSVHPTVTGDVTDEADNCSAGLDATYTDSEVVGCEGSKVLTRTWHLTDNCGNSAADQVQVITILDTIAPTFTRPPDIELSRDNACQISDLPVNTGDVTNEQDNCSTGLQATYVDSAPVTGLCSTTFTRTWSLSDHCGNKAPDQVQTITITDKIPPVLADPPSASFCVESITQASYYEPTIDITPGRPELYHLLPGSTDLDLNPLVFFSDNCTPVNNLLLHWRIDFAADPVPAVSSVSGTGQPSAFGMNIVFMGDGLTFNDVNHKITYWLTDQCGNESAHKEATITIKPRPNIIKMTL